MPDVHALVQHWNDEPTPGMMLRAYFGIEAAKQKRRPELRDFYNDVRGLGGDSRSIKKARPELFKLMGSDKKAANG